MRIGSKEDTLRSDARDRRTGSSGGADLLDDRESAVLRTVVYSSLFQFPLTAQEVEQSLIGADLKAASILDLLSSSPALRSALETQDGFIFPRGKSAFVRTRRERKEFSRRFLHEHRTVLRLICSIPYTRLVALSGSAAHANIESGGDIDLFILVRGRRVWSTALSILALTKLLGCRKTICFNFILSQLKPAIESQDLFTANQMLHLRALIGSSELKEFIASNDWVDAHYPNREGRISPAADIDVGPGPAALAFKRFVEAAGRLGPAWIFESLSRSAYRRYLRSKSHRWSSPEQVKLDSDCMKLHAASHRRRVLERFEEAYQEALQKITAQRRRTAVS